MGFGPASRTGYVLSRKCAGPQVAFGAFAQQCPLILMIEDSVGANRRSRPWPEATRTGGIALSASRPPIACALPLCFRRVVAIAVRVPEMYSIYKAPV